MGDYYSGRELFRKYRIGYHSLRRLSGVPPFSTLCATATQCGCAMGGSGLGLLW